MVRRTRIAAVLTLAMINAFTIAAGLAVVHMLPLRLAALQVPSVAAGPPVGAGTVLDGRSMLKDTVVAEDSHRCTGLKE